VEAEYAEKSEILRIIHKLLQAHALYEKDVEYVVQEGRSSSWTSSTGRLMPAAAGRMAAPGRRGQGRRAGARGEPDLATITIQNYFRMYEKLSGMTGTAETEETEFHDIYKLAVVVIPTNRPWAGGQARPRVQDAPREVHAIVDEVEREHKRGLPVLVGTVNVEVSETLARMLKRRGLKHEVLNAKFHQREAEIVALAGQSGSITIATNMAGRGTDISLAPA